MNAQLRHFSTALIAVVLGILTNLISSFFENSLGRQTLVSTVAMILVVLLVIIIGFFLDPTSRNVSREVQKLKDNIARIRTELRHQKFRHESGIPVTPRDIDIWLERQKELEKHKNKLRSIEIPVPDDGVDSAPPPILATSTKAIIALKQIIYTIRSVTPIVLFFLVVLMSVTASYTASLVIHRLYRDYVDFPHPDPVLIIPVLTPTPVVNVPPLDSDSDGLTDVAESWWCTDPIQSDSDLDGISDGNEVKNLIEWMQNKVVKAPTSGKPFQGWPIDHSGCEDNDKDGIPDEAEVMDLGLDPNRESTDEDKYDDGQELFSQTYCTGVGGFCGYGALPRNEDWGIIFADMPSWVSLPGNHPLVAAVPIIEISIITSSFRVETTTQLTTDRNVEPGSITNYKTTMNKIAIAPSSSKSLQELTKYSEEYAVSNKFTFLSSQEWSGVTAVDSNHSADLRFSYTISNVGTDYSRELRDTAFNIFWGSDAIPSGTYLVGLDVGGDGTFKNFMPNETHTYESRPVPLSLMEFQQIDTGGPIRIAISDLSFGIDQLLYEDIYNSNVLVVVQNATKGNVQELQSYPLALQRNSTLLEVISRYFPYSTVESGALNAIWTPEYQEQTPQSCLSPTRPSDAPRTYVWCKHMNPVIEVWNGSSHSPSSMAMEIQSIPALPGSGILIRIDSENK